MTNSPYRTMDDNKRPTEDETLLEGPQPQERRDKAQILVSDPWRVLRIMGEFVWGFDNLSDVRDGVSIFGSARTKPNDPQYKAAVETARLLAQAGIPVITGGGPGIMEAANRGVHGRQGTLDRLQHRAALRAGLQRLPEPEPQLQVLLRAEDDVREVRHRVHRLPRWIRNDGRAVRGAHPDPDREGREISR